MVNTCMYYNQFIVPMMIIIIINIMYVYTQQNNQHAVSVVSYSSNAHCITAIIISCLLVTNKVVYLFTYSHVMIV